MVTMKFIILLVLISSVSSCMVQLPSGSNVQYGGEPCGNIDMSPGESVTVESPNYPIGQYPVHYRQVFNLHDLIKNCFKL